MSLLVVTACVALGIGVIVARSRSLALALTIVQSLLLAGVAVDHAFGQPELAPAAVGLLLRAAAIATILGIGISRTREQRLVQAGIEPMQRAIMAFAAMLTIPPLVPWLAAGDRRVQDAAIALVVLGVVIVLTRRATIVQILGIVVVENGATMLALSAGHGVPRIIELGVVFDLLLVAVVATAYHARIFGHFGSGDVRHLEGLHD